MIEEAFAGLTADQAVARLDAARIANGRIDELEEVWRHPQFTVFPGKDRSSSVENASATVAWALLAL